MADVRPLNALHYNLAAIPSLADVVAPPYDVIDAERRAAPARALAVQHRRDRPPARPRGPRPLRARRRDARGVDAPGRPHRRPRADPLGADPGVHRPRRRPLQPPRPALPRRRHRVRPRARPPARAHPARAEAGPPPAHRGDAPQHVADLLAPPRRRLAARRGAHRGRALGRGHRRRRHRQPDLADRRSRRARGRQRRARRLRAADRRRPPPLRDRPHLRRRDRRRRAAPLHADGARLARGPRPHRLRLPPPALEPRRIRTAGGAPRRAPLPVRRRGGRARRPRPRRRGGRRRVRVHRRPPPQAVSPPAQGPGGARGGDPRRLAGLPRRSTPRSSRRSCSAARSG